MGWLDRVKTSANSQPLRIYFYAPEKWGKTSWASYAEKSIFLMTKGETGLLDLLASKQLPPTAHFPEDFRSWPDLVSAVQEIGRGNHDYKNLVIDTANGAERLLAEWVLENEFDGRQNGKGSYGDFGKGDITCTLHWSQFLRELDVVRTNKRMDIILLAHAQIKTVNNPEGDDYDQLRPEGMNKLWPLTHKWAGVIAAGTYKTFVKDDKVKEGGKERVIRTRSSAAVVCGNRYGLPETIACGTSPKSAWDAFNNALQVCRQNEEPEPPEFSESGDTFQFGNHTKSLEDAESADSLKKAFTEVHKGRHMLSKEQYEKLVDVKDVVKARLAAPKVEPAKPAVTATVEQQVTEDAF